MTKMPGPFKRRSKAAMAREAFRNNPNANPAMVAKKCGLSTVNVYPYREQVRRELAEENSKVMELTPEMEVDSAILTGEFNDLMYAITQGHGGKRTPPTGVDETLDARAATYGKFINVAETTQTLMHYVGGRLNERGVDVAHDQALALYMICQKIARIANGDPNHADSWLDIAGYATLVAERLTGKEPR